jgi:AcrR family transcriptional regulator
VLGAARDLLAAQGVEALTMRAVADRLGVHANALYSHVDGKAGLIDAVLDDALAAVAAPVDEQAPPVDGIHAVMTATYDALLAQSELIPLYLARQGARGPHAQHLGEIVRRLLSAAGVSGLRAEEALHVLIVYTIGAAAFATRSPLSANDDPGDHRAHFVQGLRWLQAGITGPRRT